MAHLQKFMIPLFRQGASLRYRLVALRSTSPEELYQKKLASEEFGDALQLAQRYKLDTDLVFRNQWEKSPRNLPAISDFLVFLQELGDVFLNSIQYFWFYFEN